MKRFKIETMSPIHTGSGTFLQPNTEFLRQGSQIGVIDDKKCLEIIGFENVDQWVNCIERGDDLFSLLKTRKPQIELNDVAKRLMPVYAQNLSKMATLKEQMHNGTGLPYLAGSSLKGAIRTAVFSELLKSEGNIVDNQLKLPNNRFSSSVLEKRFFGNNPNKDVFRFLRVGDAYFKKNETVAMQMVNLNIRTATSKLMDTKKSQLVEAIAQDKNTEFEMYLDMKSLKLNLSKGNIANVPEAFNSMEELLKTIQNHTYSLLDKEYDFWNDQQFEDDQDADAYLGFIADMMELCNDFDGKSCLVRLGHGSGWTFTTGGWVKDSKLVSEAKYDEIVNASRPFNKRDYSEYVFPKSRRITEADYGFGFVKLTMLD